jgi:hypothetical protein
MRPPLGRKGQRGMAKHNVRKRLSDRGRRPVGESLFGLQVGDRRNRLSVALFGWRKPLMIVGCAMAGFVTTSRYHLRDSSSDTKR